MADPIRIPVGRGLFALVDADDAERVSRFRWRTQMRGRSRGDYVCRSTGRGKTAETLLLHRVLTGCVRGDGRIVDHINHNPLDNRRANLRIADPSRNQYNVVSANMRRGLPKGTSWSKKCGKWQAKIQVAGRAIWLGAYEDREDAARAYDAAARKYFGDFACCNFPLISEVAHAG